MFFLKAIAAGAIAGMSVLALSIIVTIVLPVTLQLARSTGGGGIVGFEFSPELLALASAIGFVGGFGWVIWRELTTP